MKRYFLFLYLVPALAFADLLVSASDTASLTDSQALELVLKLIGGIPGASAMAVTLIVVQVLAVAMRSQLGNRTGAWKLTVLSALALVLGFLGLISQGVPVSAALLHASMLPLIQNFVAQVVIQYRNRTPDAAATASSPAPATPPASPG